jgi:hypothetical protein
MDRQRFDRLGARTRRAGLTVPVALVAVALLLAACGGNGGNGNGNGNEPSAVLHALIVNASDVEVIVGYSADGAPEPDLAVPSCEAALQDYPLADPFVVTIDGETVIDTFVDLPDGLPNDGESDLNLQIDIKKDGTVAMINAQGAPASADVALRPGRGFSKPSKSAFCPTLPG